MLTDKGKALQLQDLLTGPVYRDYEIVWKINEGATSPLEALKSVWYEYFTANEADFFEIYLDGEKVASYSISEELEKLESK